MSSDRRTLLLLGWLLVQVSGGSVSRIGEFPSSCMCGSARDAYVADETAREVDGAILALPPENAQRQKAWARAAARVAGRYQCRPER